MDEERLPFGYTHRQQKRSHAQMDHDDASADPAWRYEAFRGRNNNDNDREAPSPPPRPTYHYHTRTAHAIDNADVDLQSLINEDEDPAARYLRGRRLSPSFESALRAHARPPLERADPSASATHSHTAGLYAPRAEPMASPATHRFAGDGFDYRRPAGSARELDAATPVDLTGDDGDDGEDDVMVHVDQGRSQEENVIDLTDDDARFDGLAGGRETDGETIEVRGQRVRRHAPRLPRGMDIIIDLDNGDEEWDVDIAITPPPAEPGQDPGSPEIEFISSRTIPGGRRTHGLPAAANNANNANANAADDDDDDDEEVEFLHANALPEHEQRRRQATEQMDNVLDLFGTLTGRFTHLRAQVERFHDQINRTRTQFGGVVPQEPIAPARSASRGRAPHIRVGVGAFMAPVMDFEMVGFEIGGGRNAEREREARPTYEKPEEAPEGFTRSPEEDGGALVCPNCEEELCVGGDEVKRQVWIVKGCGHVYCGECTTNRSAKRSAKGKERERPVSTNPFRVCVVEGCERNVAHKKSMIQVFL